LEDTAGLRIAVEFLDSVDTICGLIGENPGIGRPRPELQADLRSHPVGSYMIFYRERPDHVLVVRVVHQRRDLTRVFGKRRKR
jgi:toxin ParE1/3/4